MAALILILCGANQPNECVDVVDRIEVNHVCNNDGTARFDQYIVWTWNGKDDRWDVVSWRMLGPNPTLSRSPIPHYCYRTGWYISDWYDEKSRKRRVIKSRQFRETWANFDREIVEREVLPEHERRKLR